MLQATVTEAVRPANAFAQAGVDRLVIKPIGIELDDFVDQLRRFTTEVVPRLSNQGD